MAEKRKPGSPDIQTTISRLDITAFPSDAQKAAKAFQQQAYRLVPVPESMREYERDVDFLEEREPSQKALAELLFNDASMRLIVPFYTVGAEIDASTRRLENQATDVINKATKGKKQLTPGAARVVDTMLGVIDRLDYDNPFDSLPEGSPTLSDLAAANIRTGEFQEEHTPASLATQAQIPSLFQMTGNPEHMGTVAFLTHLAKYGIEDVIEFGSHMSRVRLPGVSAETVKMLQDAGDILSEYINNRITKLVGQSFGETKRDEQDMIAFPSYFPVVLAACTLSSYQAKSLTPASFAALVESGLIKGLEPEVQEMVKDKFNREFDKSNASVYEKADNQGVKPYALLRDKFDTKRSLDFLNDVAPHYNDKANPKDEFFEFFWERRRVENFLKDKVVTVPGDERIAAMYVTNMGKGMDVILLSHGGDVMGIQFHTWGSPYSVNVSGIPGGYAQEAKGLIASVFSKALTAIRNAGYLDTPEGRVTYRTPESQKISDEFHQSFKAKIADQAVVISPDHSIAIHLPQKPEIEVVPAEPVKKRRFTISIPDSLIAKSGLSEEEKKALRDEIEEVEFSEPGTYPMRNMEGYKGDVKRIKIKKLATTPNGEKVRVNLRAIVEFDGTNGVVIKAANRQGVYN